MSTTLSTETLGAPPLPDEPEPIQRRLLKPHTLFSFAIAIAIVVFLVLRLDIDLSAVWTNIRNANPVYFFAGLVLYYLTFAVRTYRWRYMLRQAGVTESSGYRMPSIPHLYEIMMLSWFANCVVPAKLGDGYRSYLLKRDARVPASTSLGTILAERITDLTVLFITMTAAGVIAFHGDLPSRVQQTMLIGAGLMSLAVLALVVLFFARDYVQRVVPERFTRHYHDFHGAVFACLRRPVLPILVSISIWAADGVRLYLVARALDVNLTITVAIFVALMAALLTTLPITPAGLGVVEAAVIVVLSLVDVNETLAGSVAVLDRVIGYWSLILVGCILYIRRLRRDVAVAPEA